MFSFTYLSRADSHDDVVEDTAAEDNAGTTLEFSTPCSVGRSTE